MIISPCSLRAPHSALILFFNATDCLENALARPSLSALEKEGAARRFMFAADAGWKALKYFLEAAGSAPVPPTPPAVLSAAWRLHIIFDGHLWMDMLSRRSELVRDNTPETIGRVIEETRRRFMPEILRLRVWFQSHSPDALRAAPPSQPVAKKRTRPLDGGGALCDLPSTE
ncbi:MAG TPA: nucleotidyltransferase substrate binding protein [Candidatus Bilophila faecipullorum]|uniref:Nucleotidyltransferase substrate binding protein n=4 Tax=Bilophila TaxID=35832 RepID=A0A9D1QZ73_9BACT|nr:nucleotidyltransferase substrate binding protein [uncultured Bilophila sp.]HIW78756.1 nucleotidyltransferase substrate binding protein [Candidatus Bilophila faecipullorum]